MRILKRMLDFIASRMLMVTVACALLIISFYLIIEKYRNRFKYHLTLYCSLKYI